MSYDIARSLSINVDKKVLSGSFAPNNIHPIMFEKSRMEFTRSGKENLLTNITEKDYFLALIVRDLSGGMLKLRGSVGVKYLYAYNEIMKYGKKYNNKLYEITSKIHDENRTDEDARKIKDIVNKFEELLKMKDKEIKKVVKIRNSYFVKASPRSIKMSRYKEDAKVFTSMKELKLHLDRLGDKVTSVEDY